MMPINKYIYSPFNVVFDEWYENWLGAYGISAKTSNDYCLEFHSTLSWRSSKIATWIKLEFLVMQNL